ncbi:MULTISPECIES: M23 family metallopeptidase [Bacillaceae]|uniref:Peptidoglycan DD-metalloendopeptidase family protein n=1 Tax=Evansella alkalicola TaxID=745819 RepID=A0ABS6JWN3_9BACI|nr:MULTISPECIES: M23 family metallopeptidase [Bacillaceae]MBU9722084.1 peptidoglycan DD-metalloendopeptidase family protein [Bacillus alkalicola]
MFRQKKKWNVIYFSSPKQSVRQFPLTRRFIILSFICLFATVASIAGYINSSFEERELKQLQLYKEIELKEKEVEKANIEIQQASQENQTLQEEILNVQQTIEEFKEFEKHLNDLELELEVPSDLNNSEGSGGLAFPHAYDEVQDISTQLLQMQEELPELISAFENSINRLQEYERELRKIPTIMPTKEGRISSNFGNRIDPFTRSSSFHSGIDIAAPLNTPIFATADGKVTQAGWDNNYGQRIVIRHSDTYETLYAHLNRIDVKVGDWIEKGDQIGGMGTTGRSTGVHLHYEIIRNGDHVNPYPYMTFHENAATE